MADVKVTDLPEVTNPSVDAVALIVDSNASSQITLPNAVKGGLPSQTGQDGKVLSTNAGSLQWIPAVGAGTVTSVNVSGGTTGLTASGGPVTTSGIITLGGVLSPANGGTGVATISGLVKGNGTTAMTAATAADVVSTIGATHVQNADYATTAEYVVGMVPIANGGTGQTTASAAINTLLPAQSGNAGKVLGTNGIAASWVAAGSGTGTVTSVGVSGGTTGLTVSGSPVTTSGTMTLDGTLNIANGGTGATTANAATNALLPAQTGNNGKVLGTNGTDTSWVEVGGTGTVTSVDVSGGTTGLTTSGGPITAAGSITLGGTLSAANGGTGVNTITGIVKGNGANAMSAATDSDIVNTLGATPVQNAGYATTAEYVVGMVPIANGGTGQTTASAAINTLLPTQTGNSGRVLGTNGAQAGWVAASTGTVTSVAVSGGATGLTVTGSPITTSGTVTLGGTVSIAHGGTGATTATAATNALLPSQTGNAGKVLGSDGTNTGWVAVQSQITTSNRLDASLVGTGVVSNVEFNYLDGVTSSIQTQINDSAVAIDALSGQVASLSTSKQNVITTTSRLDASLVGTGVVSNTEFNYLDGVTSAIQTQLNAKQATLSATNRLDAAFIGSGLVDSTEYGYLNGVTSSIQNQLNTKQPAMAFLTAYDGTATAIVAINDTLIEITGLAIGKYMINATVSLQKNMTADTDAVRFWAIDSAINGTYTNRMSYNSFPYADVGNNYAFVALNDILDVTTNNAAIQIKLKYCESITGVNAFTRRLVVTQVQ